MPNYQKHELDRLSRESDKILRYYYIPLLEQTMRT